MKLNVLRPAALAAAVTLLVAPTLTLAETVVQSVVKNCETELNSYCKSVTRGEGRLLYCFKAHEDKLSPSCRFALIDGSLRVERKLLALENMAHQCEVDADKHCADVPIGGGRVARCLQEKKKGLSPGCRDAIARVKLQ